MKRFSRINESKGNLFPSFFNTTGPFTLKFDQGHFNAKEVLSIEIPRNRRGCPKRAIHLSPSFLSKFINSYHTCRYNRLSDYQDIYDWKSGQILRLPNGFHNTTVYWGKRVW